jgi:hypothetical protein
MCGKFFWTQVRNAEFNSRALVRKTWGATELSNAVRHLVALSLGWSSVHINS